MTTTRLALISLLIGLLAAPGCRPVPIADRGEVRLMRTPHPDPLPQYVRRLAVLYPREADRDQAYAYARLEHALLRVKQRRPWVRVLDRRHLTAVTDEQRLQLSGRVTDDSAVQIGKLIGADSIVLFRIDGPGWRERLLARMHGAMPPIVVSSTIVHVESGEILYHDVIVRTPLPGPQAWEDYGSDYELQPLLQASLELSLSEAIANLDEAFR